MTGRSRDGGSRAGAALGAAALLLALAGPARAEDIETRDFAVMIGGKAVGEVRMTVKQEDATTVSLRCDTDIKITFGLIPYKYSLRLMEVWKDKRLSRLESSTDDNSKKYTVSAAPDGRELKVKVNGVERGIKTEAWTSSFWMLPDPKLRDAALTVLDADTGKDMDGKLAYVATEKMRVATQEVTLNHYRLTGKVNAELWYDGHDRLVRQEWTEQGQKAVMLLVRVRR